MKVSIVGNCTVVAGDTKAALPMVEAARDLELTEAQRLHVFNRAAFHRYAAFLIVEDPAGGAFAMLARSDSPIVFEDLEDILATAPKSPTLTIKRTKPGDGMVGRAATFEIHDEVIDECPNTGSACSTPTECIAGKHCQIVDGPLSERADLGNPRPVGVGVSCEIHGTPCPTPAHCVEQRRCKDANLAIETRSESVRNGGPTMIVHMPPNPTAADLREKVDALVNEWRLTKMPKNPDVFAAWEDLGEVQREHWRAEYEAHLRQRDAERSAAITTAPDTSDDEAIASWRLTQIPKVIHELAQWPTIAVNVREEWRQKYRALHPNDAAVAAFRKAQSGARGVELEWPKLAEVARDVWREKYALHNWPKDPANGRPLCSPARPMPKGAVGQWAHTGARMVSAGDYADDYKCDDCGTRWTEELPE